MTPNEHNRLAGIFLMVHGGFQALTIVLVAVIYGVLGTVFVATGKGEEKFVGAVMYIAVIFIAIIGSAFVLPQLIGGWKMLKERPGAKSWAVVGSIISCFSFPLGTAAGVYVLWFLFGEQGKAYELSRGTAVFIGAPSYQNQQQTPPPYNWK